MGPKSQGSTEKISNRAEKRARQKTFDHEWGRSDEGLPPSQFWKVCFGSHQSIFENSRNCFYSDVQKKSDIEKNPAQRLGTNPGLAQGFLRLKVSQSLSLGFHKADKNKEPESRKCPLKMIEHKRVQLRKDKHLYFCVAATLECLKKKHSWGEKYLQNVFRDQTEPSVRFGEKTGLFIRRARSPSSWEPTGRGNDNSARRIWRCGSG